MEKKQSVEFVYTISIKASQVLCLAIVILFSSLNAQSSLKMFVEGEAKQEMNELIARSVRDANGEVCAGLIIYSDLKGLSFQSNNGIVKRTSDPGRDLLFLSQDERLVEIYCSGFTPLKLFLNDAGIRLKSGTVWSVKITGEKKMELIPVNFIVKPESTVISVDGIDPGTAVNRRLTEGVHIVRASKDGFKSLEQRITVSAVQNLFTVTLQEVELQKVTITSQPESASVFIENVQKGFTNKQLFLYPDTYRIKLSKNGYGDIDDSISVLEKGPNTFNFSLLKNTGMLRLLIVPEGARVMINREEYRGQDLAPGRYKLEIEKDGYRGISESIDINKNVVLEKRFVMTALTGDLQVTITPIEAKAVLRRNGVIVKQWEGADILRSLPVGVYDLAVSAPGYAVQNRSVTVREQLMTNEEFTLVKGNIPAVSPVDIEFIFVEGGSFQMGRENGEASERPVHTVKLRNFRIGKYEVTQKQWTAVMGWNRSKFRGEDLPVENVNWNEAQEFIRKLNEQEGETRYRLPTEAEWEFAAGGGVKGKRKKFSGSETIDPVGWFVNNADSTNPVGKKKANELGIYDMSGNVSEFCSDRYSEKYYSVSPAEDPQGAETGDLRSLRGGSWYQGSNVSEIRDRHWCDPRFSSSEGIGFRLAKDP